MANGFPAVPLGLRYAASKGDTTADIVGLNESVTSRRSSTRLPTTGESRSQAVKQLAMLQVHGVMNVLTR